MESIAYAIFLSGFFILLIIFAPIVFLLRKYDGSDTATGLKELFFLFQYLAIGFFLYILFTHPLIRESTANWHDLQTSSDYHTIVNPLLLLAWLIQCLFFLVCYLSEKSKTPYGYTKRKILFGYNRYSMLLVVLILTLLVMPYVHIFLGHSYGSGDGG